MTVRTSSASRLLGQHGEVDEVGEQDGDELALLGDGPGEQLGTLGEQRLEGRVDHRVAEQGALRFERGDGVVDRRQIRHATRLTTSRSAPALRASAADRSTRRTRRSTGSPPVPGRRRRSARASASSAAASAGEGAARPSSARQAAPGAASASTASISLGRVGLGERLGPGREDGELALVEVADGRRR